MTTGNSVVPTRKWADVEIRAEMVPEIKTSTRKNNKRRPEELFDIHDSRRELTLNVSIQTRIRKTNPLEDLG